eukprot:jgi/Chrzof1/11274/Cz05g30070.t1
MAGIAAFLAFWVLCAAAQQFNLQQTCPGNLIGNGGFEEPNVRLVPGEKDHWDGHWGWYPSMPGGWTFDCLKVDWGPNKRFELHRRAVETAPEGMQVKLAIGL